jgi:hypothetical protein
LARDAIDSCPGRAIRTGPPHRVVDAFFVDAPDDAFVSNRFRDLVSVQERGGLREDGRVVPDVAAVGEPLAHRDHGVVGWIETETTSLVASVGSEP